MNVKSYAQAVVAVRGAESRPVEADLLDFGPAPDDPCKLLLRVCLLGQLQNPRADGLIMSQYDAETHRLFFQGDIEVLDVTTGEVVVAPAPEHPLPKTGSRLLIEPPDYLKALAEFADSLERDNDGESRLKRYENLRNNLLSDVNGAAPLACPKMPDERLRKAQSKALEAACQNQISFIWGPPGTGKSYTLGSIVEVFVRQGKRVLVVSTTNAAVDVTTFAIDDAFTASGSSLGHGVLVRYSRVLTQVEKYSQRPHLTAYTDLLRRLLAEQQDVEREIALIETKLASDLAIEGSPRRDGLLTELASQKSQVVEIGERRRAEVKRLLDQARIVCVTFTSAIYNRLLDKSEFDVVVIDEASQMALACWPYFFCERGGMPPRFVIAGDPCQLRPICSAKELPGDYLKWFKTNLYGYLGMETATGCKEFVAHGVMNFLDEQSRMKADICQRVSQLFYNGWLHGDCAKPIPPWPEKAGIPNAAVVGWEASAIEPVKMRIYQSMNTDLRHIALVEEIVRRIMKAASIPIEILVISPFSNQAKLLERRMQALAKPTSIVIRACTVHRAQGSEADIVILDTVEPSSWFLNNPEAVHLWCVACSRAKSQLFVIGDSRRLAAGRYSGLLMANVTFERL